GPLVGVDVEPLDHAAPRVVGAALHRAAVEPLREGGVVREREVLQRPHVALGQVHPPTVTAACDTHMLRRIILIPTVSPTAASTTAARAPCHTAGSVSCPLNSARSASTR